MAQHYLRFEIGPDATATGGAGHRARCRILGGPVGGPFTDFGPWTSDPESGDDGVREWTFQTVDVSALIADASSTVLEFRFESESTEDASYLRRIRIGDPSADIALNHYPEYPLGCKFTQGQVLGADLPSDGLMLYDGGADNTTPGSTWNACTEAFEESGTYYASIFFTINHLGPTVGYIGPGLMA